MIEEARIKLKELAGKKRSELETALDARQVHDPFTIAGVVITWQAIALSAAVSAVASAASYALSKAFAPKPERQTIGKLQGTIALMNSEQGIMIPEIYGAGPTASIVAGSDPTWQNLTNTTGGVNGSITKTSGANNNYNAGASHNVAPVAGQDCFIRVIRGSGHASAGFFTTASPTGSGAHQTGMLYGLAWAPGSGPLWRVVSGLGDEIVGSTDVGDTFTIEIRSGRFRIYKGSAEITNIAVATPAPTYPLWFGVIMYSSGAGVSNAKVQIGSIGDPPNYAKGGIKVPAIIDWSSGIRKNVNVTQTQVGGKGFMGGQSQTTENITYDIDLGLTFARGPLTLLRAYANADVLIDQTDTSLLLTGVYDPTTGADPDYDPELPPDPTEYYNLPRERVNATIPFDGDGVGTGSIQGGATNFAVYSGTETQDPDPTEEADIDSRFGAGSTPAHRGKARIVHTNFDLSRWGGIVPNMTAAWENPTLATLDDIFGSMCERVNVKAATSDYDFSGISTIQSRGMLIAGRLFSPAEVIGSPDIQTVYNYFVTEAEGQIVGFIEGAEPSVTIADTEIGWMDSDGDVADILPEVDTVLASEVGLSRQVDVKYIDLDKEWEPNTQSDNRQITEGVSTEVMEVQLALLGSEARTAAQRKLYRDYVAGSVHKFTLPWTYLYLYPGYKITITRAEGFSHVLKLTSLSGGLGVLECEGVAIEPAAFTQPATGSITPGFPPDQPIPAMTVLTLLDTPLLRDGDETNNNGVGFYTCGTPRTGVNQSWTGFALYRNRNSVFSLIGSSTLPGTIGTIVSATGLSTADPSVWDRTGVFVVDLYGTTATLASVTEQDVLADATVNLALFGDMVGQFVTATQVADFPNRWSLSILLNGRRGTEDHVSDTFTGLRFVLINAAVLFIPAMITDVNGLFEYRAPTSGQSLGDAATIDFAWTGETLRPLSPVNLTGTRDSEGGLLIEWTRRSRISPGLTPGSDVPLAEEEENYAVEILTTGNVLKRTIPVSGGGSRAAILLPVTGHGSGTVDRNNLISSLSATGPFAYTHQELAGSGSWIEASLYSPADNFASLGLTATSRKGLERAAGDVLDINVIYSRTNMPAGASSPGLHVYIHDAPLTGIPVPDFSTGSLGSVELVRIRILLSGTEIRFYWDYTGPGSVPFYAASVAPTFPLVGYAQIVDSTGVARVDNINVGTVFSPSTIYSDEQQVEDFGSIQNPIRVRVSQVSATVGRGPYVQGDL